MPRLSRSKTAREAGVGIGTVFRHFPTKKALLEAVFVAQLRRLAEDAEALASAEDPGDVKESAAKTGPELKRALGALLARA